MEHAKAPKTISILVATASIWQKLLEWFLFMEILADRYELYVQINQQEVAVNKRMLRASN